MRSFWKRKKQPIRKEKKLNLDQDTTLKFNNHRQTRNGSDFLVFFLHLWQL